MGIETLLLAAGTAVSVIGSLSAGKAEKKSADFSAAVREQQAASERDAASAESSDYFRREHRARSAARAMRGASGVTQEGSPLLVDEASVREAALGTARILHGGDRRATRAEQEADLYRMRGDNALTASYFDAGTSLLTGGAKAFKAWGS